MREVIRAYQNAVTGEIAHFEGHVAKFMGDGVLAISVIPKRTRTIPSAPFGLVWRLPERSENCRRPVAGSARGSESPRAGSWSAT